VLKLKKTWQDSPKKAQLFGLGAAGAFLGMSAYVARLSNAASYLSDDPKACINCHVMNPEFASWQHSSHARVAVCNDCHVPHDNLLSKYLYKAKDGTRHSFMFTFHMEPQVMKPTEEAKRVIQANCMRCHETLMESTYSPIFHSTERPCTECHREVPHGRVHSLTSTPNAAIPPLSPVTPDWMRATEKQ